MERFPKKIFQNLIERGFEEAIFNKFKNIEAFYITKKTKLDLFYYQRKVPMVQLKKDKDKGVKHESKIS